MSQLYSNKQLVSNRSTGFTLIEILMTLVIAVAITAISATAYSRLSSSAALKATAQDILVSLRQARISAMAKSEEVAFAIDNQKRIYWFCSHCKQTMPNIELQPRNINQQKVYRCL